MLFDAFGLAKGTSLDFVGEGHRIIDYNYTRTTKITVTGKKTRLNKKLLSNSAYNFSDLMPTGDKIFQTSATFLLKGSKAEIDAAVQATLKGIRDTIDYKRPPNWFIITNEVLGDPYVPDSPIYGGKISELIGFKLFKGAIGLGLDIAVGGYLQYLDDVDNPYLTSGQKIGRAIVSGSGSVGISAITLSGLGALGCTATIYCGITAGIIGTIIWINLGQLFAFDVLPGLQPSDRNLQPLSP